MTILFICDEYPPGNNGGIGTTVQNLGRALSAQGHTVLVAGLYAYRYREKNYEEDGAVKVWRKRYGMNLHLPSKSKAYTALEKLPDPVKKHLNGKKAFQKFIAFLQELIETHQVDVIEIADFNSFAMYIGFTVQWPAFKAPLILKSHGSYTYFCHELGESPLPKFRRNDEALFARADAFSCVSHYTAAINKQLFHLKAPVTVLYNGIEVPPVDNKIRKPFTVVFTGTLVYKKGIFSLLRAWNKVYEKFPQAELLVYGKGSTRKLRPLLNEQSKDSVRFLGHVKREELLEQLTTATLAVFPSYSETFGMGVVEAMSKGCPVIYTKRSCGPEIVKDGVEGLLVDPDRVDEISGAIEKLLASPAERKTLAEAAYQSVSARFRMEKSAKDHLSFYTDVVQQFKYRKTSAA